MSDDGNSFIEVSTSRGTEGLSELYPNLVKKRVPISNYLNYVKVEPIDSGCIYTRVHMIDLSGKSP